jgi:heterodisulfide reductase subunit A-like polyferredoxin
MLASWRVTLAPCFYNKRLRSGFCCRADALQSHANGGKDNDKNKLKKKVVIVGSGWAGLGAAHHLCNQGFDVTVLEGSPDDVGIRGNETRFPSFCSLRFIIETGIWVSLMLRVFTRTRL